MITRFIRPWAAALLLVALAGCGGPPPVTVTGKVTKDGKPIEVSKTGVVQITLVPDVAKGQDYTTKVGRAEPDGKFTIPDVPQGKYKVSVVVNDPDPRSDKLKGVFSPDNTKITRQIDGKGPLEIDLSKP